MEIITNNQFIDTVTWIGVANSTSELVNLYKILHLIEMFQFMILLVKN